MKRRYAQSGEPGRNLFELIASLGPADNLTVEHSSAFGSNPIIRAAFLNAINARGIRLRVTNIAPEHVKEIREHQNVARKARYARAAERGAYAACGRPQTIDRDQIKQLLDQGLNGREVARKLDLPQGTVYRIRDELRRDEVRRAA
jgi:hypothetical protein